MPKFMKLLPDIKYHMESLSQYFHIYFSNNTVVMKKTNITSNLKSNCINLFLRLKLQTKPCHIIDLLHRELHKNSEKSTFAILRLFCELLCICKVHTRNLQKQRIKENDFAPGMLSISRINRSPNALFI